MGHHTGRGNTGTPSGTTFASGINTQNDIWYDVPDPPSGGCYVDALHFYCGGGDSGLIGGHSNSINSHLWLGYWNGGGHTVAVDSGNFSAANGIAWQDRTGLTPVHVTQTILSVGWYSDPSTYRTWKSGGGGTWHYDTQTGAWPISPGVGSNGSGDLGAYYDWWDPCAVTGVPGTPVGIGQVIVITGTSFSATISSIDINGTNVSTYTVNNDGQITLTVPAGATTGPVHVFTNVGEGISGTLTIATARVRRTSAWSFATSDNARRTSAWNAATQVAARRGTGWASGQ